MRKKGKGRVRKTLSLFLSVILLTGSIGIHPLYAGELMTETTEVQMVSEVPEADEGPADAGTEQVVQTEAPVKDPEPEPQVQEEPKEKAQDGDSDSGDTGSQQEPAVPAETASADGGGSTDDQGRETVIQEGSEEVTGKTGEEETVICPTTETIQEGGETAEAGETIETGGITEAGNDSDGAGDPETGDPAESGTDIGPEEGPFVEKIEEMAPETVGEMEDRQENQQESETETGTEKDLELSSSEMEKPETDAETGIDPEMETEPETEWNTESETECETESEEESETETETEEAARFEVHTLSTRNVRITTSKVSAEEGEKVTFCADIPEGKSIGLFYVSGAMEASPAFLPDGRAVPVERNGQENGSFSMPAFDVIIVVLEEGEETAYVDKDPRGTLGSGGRRRLKAPLLGAGDDTSQEIDQEEDDPLEGVASVRVIVGKSADFENIHNNSSGGRAKVPEEWERGANIHSTNIYSAVFEVTEEDGSKKTYQRYAYCVQPAAINGQAGTWNLNSGSVTELTDSSAAGAQRMAKLLYFLYGGPGWGKDVTLTDASGKETTINLKKILDNGGAGYTKGQYYAMSHYVLGYAYALWYPDNANSSRWYMGWTSSGQEPVRFTEEAESVIRSTVQAVDKLSPQYLNVSLSSRHLGSSVSSGVLRSEPVRLNAESFVQATVRLPAGITMVSENSGSAATVNGTIHGGETVHFETKELKTYGGKTTALSGSLNTSATFKAYVKKASSSSTQDVSFETYTGFDTIDLEIAWEEGETQVQLKKVSARAAITGGNAMYDLSGAKYQVYEDAACTRPVSGGVLTTNSGGVTNTLTLTPGIYYIKETAASRGYRKNSEVFKADLTNSTSQTMVVTAPEEPKTVKADLLLKKAAGAATSRPLSDAQFSVSYYDNTSASGTPKKTGIYKTVRLQDGSFGIRPDAACFVSGQDILTEGVLPLGSLKIQEVKAPAGYQLSQTPVIRTITESGDAAVISQVPTVTDEPCYGGVKVSKTDAQTGGSPQGDASLNGAVFAIYSAEEVSLVRKDTGKAFQKGQEIARITTEGNAHTAQIPAVLQTGTYVIREIQAPAGYLIGNWERTFTLTENGQILDLTKDGAKNDVIRGGIALRKADAERESGAQGAASLEGAQFEIVSRNAQQVMVNGKIFNKDEVVMTLTTDGEGVVKTSEDALPYGTYLYREVKAPEGYTGKGSSLSGTVQIRTDQKVEDLTQKDKAAKNEIIRFDLLITKLKGSLSSEDIPEDAVPIPEVEFTVYNRNEQPVLVDGKEYGPEEAVLTLVTDENGTAQTADGTGRGRLPYGRYLIRETKHPAGVSPVSDFIIDGTGSGNVYDGKVYRGIYKNNRQIEASVRLVKTDAETGEQIPFAGVRFQLLDEQEQPVTLVNHYPKETRIDTFETDGSGCVMLPSKLPYGTYYVREIKAPEGYALPEEPQKLEVTEFASWDSPLQVVIADQPLKGKIRIQKTDAVTGEGLAGVSFGIYAAEDIITGDGTRRLAKGETADLLTTGEDGSCVSKDLYLGTYEVRELEVLQGYCSRPQPWTVEVREEEGAVPEQVLDAENMPIRIDISKCDINGDDEIPGAVLILKDAEGKEIEQWVSGNEAHRIGRLVPGRYTLTEITAPEGYARAETMEFEVKDTEVIQHVVIRDEPIRVSVSKQDITGGEELPGALLRITREDGTVVDEWTSGKEPHLIERLPAGTYHLTEITAPKGYAQAEEIVFTVRETGELQTVVMKDAPLEEESETESETEQTTEKITEAETETERHTEKETEPAGKKEKKERKGGSPKTGDETPVRWYLLLVISAAIVLAAALMIPAVRTRRKKRM